MRFALRCTTAQDFYGSTLEKHLYQSDGSKFMFVAIHVFYMLELSNNQQSYVLQQE